MTSTGTPERDTLVRHLRDSGLDIHVEAGTGNLVVPPRGAGGPTAVVEIAEDILCRYLDDGATSYGSNDDDPRENARGIAMVNVLDYLTTDHGGGVNQVRRLSLVRDDDGLHFVEERADDPGPPPPTTDEPHDHPEVFAREIEALARELRGQGLDAMADSSSSTIEVGTQGRGKGAQSVTIELRPDRYRQYLDEQEAEYEAIGGDAFGHAWTGLYRLVLYSLKYGVAGSDLRRLSFLRSDEGQVALFANAVGDEPPEPQYRWSAERGD